MGVIFIEIESEPFFMVPVGIFPGIFRLVEVQMTLHGSENSQEISRPVQGHLDLYQSEDFRETSHLVEVQMTQVIEKRVTQRE